MTATVIIFSQGLQAAFATRYGDPEDPPVVEPEEPPYEPLTNGFDWSVPSRFGRDDNQDRLIDYHYIPETFQYEKAWLYPDSWPMNFDGCRTEQDANTGVSTTNTYKWELNGQVIQGNLCRLTYTKDSPYAGDLGFPAQGTYPVTLTITYTNVADSPTGQNPEVFHQDVEVRDILIVSLGDSYTSGEGNPDIPQQYHLEWGVPIWEADAVWQDKRCHRSAKNGPALAAMAIERMDPKTSVTFISYACSGATVGTELFDGPNQSRGIGILGPYIGQEPPSDFKYYAQTGDWSHYIPSQIGQLQDVLVPPQGKSQRQVDSLIISGGGNDYHFADWTAACLALEPCWDLPLIPERPGSALYSPRQLVDRALGIAPGREADSVPVSYEHLATEIANINPGPLNVYVTQYFDPTTNDDGSYCRWLDDVLWPDPFNAITWWESADIQTHAVASINATLFHEAKERQSLGWVYVDGLAKYNLNDNDPNGSPGLFYTHGYCAFNHWIVRADEAELMQGPLYLRAATKGMVHPNILGHQAMRDRLLTYMLPRLFLQQPANPPTISAPSYQINDLVDEPGANGWYLGSCQAGACYPKAVMQVVGTAEAGVAGAGVTIDGVDACYLTGVTCRTDGGLSADHKQYTWNIELNADGVYNFQFNLRDSAGAVANGGAEIKVDLHDPSLITPGPFTVDEGGVVALEASVGDSEGSPVSYTWDLNNDGEFETYDQEPEFFAASLDGPTSQTIQVMATDQAGRTATAETQINVLNVAPSAAIIDVPVLWFEGAAINLDSLVSDPGAADTYTYAWSVKKDGLDYADGTGSPFSFTPEDNGSYEVLLSVTDDDGGVGTDSKTIHVDNVAPAPRILDAPTSSQEGTAINLRSSVTDPSPVETFTYAWSVQKNGLAYVNGSGANFSFTPDDDGSYVVSLSVTDDDGGIGTASSQTIAVTNVAPNLSNISITPGTVDEGGSVTLSGSISDPSSADSFELTVNWGDDSPASTSSLAAGSTSFNVTHTYADDNPTGTPADTYAISVGLKDDDNGTGTGSDDVTVNNLAPSLTISAPADGTLYTLNSSVSLSSAFSDTGTLDTFSCSVNWGDGASAAGTLTQGACTASHPYSAAGVYTIQMTVTDDDTGTVTEPVMVVVYDPSAGFVTGGGWIDSAAGAYKADLNLSGKATFGFVSKYQKGSTVPTGNTAFTFQVAGFEFDSTAYEWLVVNQAGTNAQFKGVGMVNGALDTNGNAYKFMIWAGDGSPDTFRIRIWWEDAAGEHDVYDNGVSQAIGGGNIVIHSLR